MHDFLIPAYLCFGGMMGWCLGKERKYSLVTRLGFVALMMLGWPLHVGSAFWKRRVHPTP